jgi:hypothetical protein
VDPSGPRTTEQIEPPAAPPGPERKGFSKTELSRLAVLGLVTAYLLSGLVLRQGLGVESNAVTRWFPVWLMFSGASRGVTQARYIDRSGGKHEPLDRFAVLGLDPLDQPRGVWRLWGRKGAYALGHRLCRKLGPGAHIEMITRTAIVGGWSRPRVVRDVCKARVESGARRRGR